MSNITGAKLLGLCTVAVSAIYAAGYTYTQSTGVLSSSMVATSGSETHVATRSVKPHGVHAHDKKPTPTRSASVAYKDGTYTGSGANPYGTLSVEVSIVHGKIASVRITSYYMHYPQSFIDPQLPQETVSMQTWRIYVVTGATASSYNFAEAVYYALQKAKK
ncbi:MAG: hypothetical protein C7B46_11725 [Sulfobacillus benefaciens]|uniref:FMN-binding domain-containing protein n=1 Tax=Sulfobacillus benefaciens TaxID=453960 RepID=A0A2T2XEX3_9FIRM|nr:MAG: hypothetical protein C7B46_11725 [Sulfobacillus benefaciens]